MSEESTVEGTVSQNYRLPNDTTMQHAVKIAITTDKPIMLDYWTGSLDKQILIGMRHSGEKLLVKNAEEYTSPVSKIYKVGPEGTEDYIIVTENSIYLISADVDTKRIQ
jgi:hypothetical protein